MLLAKTTFTEKNMIYSNILEAIGNTPLVRLSKIVPEDSAEILVKYEGLNVGGSIKTRTAYNMILEAEKNNIINKDTVIVEPTSGNQGIGLALIGAAEGDEVVVAGVREQHLQIKSVTRAKE